MISIIFSGSPVFEQVANSVKKLSILVSIPLSSSYNLSFHPLFSDISVEIYFFLPPSLRIFPGNAIIAKVESAKSEAFASCSGKKDHPPDKKRGDMSILLDIRKSYLSLM